MVPSNKRLQRSSTNVKITTTRPVARRRALTAKQRKVVLAKTDGRCHVCGRALGTRWQADHVVPHRRGGVADLANALPACRKCNRLRWAYGPGSLRKILELGVYARNEISKGTALGEKLRKLLNRKRSAKKRRRVPKGESPRLV